MCLPTELRLKVYEHLLPTDRSILFVEVGRRPGTPSTYNFRVRKSDGQPWPQLADVERVAEDPRSIFPGEGNSLFWIDNDWELLQTEEDTKLQPLVNLAKPCRTTQAEIMPLVCKDFTLRVQDLSIACWYACARPFFTSSITTLYITVEMVERGYLRERWLTQLFIRFPNLELLKIYGVHSHKRIAQYGTRYMKDDLLMMRFILNNTKLERVGTVFTTFDEDICEDDGTRGISCTPMIAFVTSVGFEKHFRHSNDGVFADIDFETELTKSGSVVVVEKGGKRKR
jgi:hypothetical protein